MITRFFTGRAAAAAIIALSLCGTALSAVPENEARPDTPDAAGVRQSDAESAAEMQNDTDVEEAVLFDIKTRRSLVLKAKEGDAEAMYALGRGLLGSYYGKAEYKEAAGLFLKSAELGNTDGMTAYATCCLRGLGTKMNLGKAFSLYKDAAEKGNARAWYGLGVCYDYGLGTVPDYYQAKDCYLKAADAGFYLGFCGLGRLNSPWRVPSGDKITSAKHYEHAVKQWLNSGEPLFDENLGSALQYCPHMIPEVIQRLERTKTYCEKRYKFIPGYLYYCLYKAYLAQFTYNTHREDDRFKAMNYGVEAVDLGCFPALMDYADNVMKSGHAKEAVAMYEDIVKTCHAAEAAEAVAAYAWSHDDGLVSREELKAYLDELIAGGWAPAERIKAERFLTENMDDYIPYIESIESAANNGDAQACFILYESFTRAMLADKWTIAPDARMAFQYLSKALESLYPFTYNSKEAAGYFMILGNCYYYGEGVNADKNKAALNYQRSVQAYFTPEAAYRWGRMLVTGEVMGDSNAKASKEKGREILKRVCSEGKGTKYAAEAAKLL